MKIFLIGFMGSGKSTIRRALADRGIRDGYLPSARPGFCGVADDREDLGADGFEADPQRLEGTGGDPLPLVDEAEEDVLGSDVVVVEAPGLLLREDDDPASSVCEPLEHLLWYLSSPVPTFVDTPSSIGLRPP